MLSKKAYEQAASIAQGYSNGTDELRSNVIQAFVALFKRDGNPRFDEARFRRACVPGANVRARGSIYAKRNA